MRTFRYFLFHKPYGVLSQFTDRSGKTTLSSFGPFPPGVYAAGRLDEDSEGLLFLTDDNAVNHRLTDPRYKHPKTYLVQVEGIPSESALKRLASGVTVQGRATRASTVRLLTEEPQLPPRTPPVRFRRSIPTSWLEITIHEGKNRQVRRMTAAVGHPTLRLVRTGIGPLTLGSLGPGETKELSGGQIREILAGGKKNPRRA